MTTISHVRGCLPATMVAFGAVLRGVNSEFVAQVEAMRGAVDTATAAWQGDSAAAAAMTSCAQQMVATKVDEVASAVADHHTAYGALLDGIRTPLLFLVDTSVPKAGMSVDDDGAVHAPIYPGATLAAKVAQRILDGQADGLQSRIRGLLADFEAAEQQASSALTFCANDLIALNQNPTSPDTHAAGSYPAEEGGPEYVIGPPTKPDIEHDDTFEYGIREPSVADNLAAAKWQAILTGGEIVRPDLDDALALYRHFWENTGEPQKFDYEEAYREDESISDAVDREISVAAAAADRMARDGQTEFSITGDARTVGIDGSSFGAYPVTDDWQKSVGGYQQWSSANVRVDGDQITMDITVEAGDYYNFDRGKEDVETGWKDDENGRFIETGLAKPFESYGSLTRTITWLIGSPPVTDGLMGADQLNGTEPSRNPGREDRIDNTDSAGSRFPPDNDGNTGTAVPR